MTCGRMLLALAQMLLNLHSMLGFICLERVVGRTIAANLVINKDPAADGRAS